MAKKGGLKNAPSTTGNKSGGGRANNTPNKGTTSKGSKK